MMDLTCSCRTEAFRDEFFICAGGAGRYCQSSHRVGHIRVCLHPQRKDFWSGAHFAHRLEAGRRVL